MFRLKNFTWSDLNKALDRRFVKQQSKDLLKKAADGDVNGFAKAIAEYKWFGTRDYTMVFIVLSPLFLAQKAKNDEISECCTGLSPTNMSKLFEALGGGRGSRIKTVVESCKDYKKLFETIMKAGGQKKNTEKVWDDLTKHLKKMTPWSFVNREIIETQLLPVLDELSDQIMMNFEAGLGPKQKTNGTFESLAPELEKIDVDDDKKLQALLDNYNLSKEDLKKIKEICSASKGMLHDTACKEIMDSAVKTLGLEETVLVSLRVLENLDKFEMKSVKNFVYQTVMKYYRDTDMGKELLQKYESKYGKLETFTEQVKREWPEMKDVLVKWAKSVGSASKTIGSVLWDNVKWLTGIKEEPKKEEPKKEEPKKEEPKKEEPKKEEPKKEEPKKEEPKKEESMDVEGFLAAVASKLKDKALTDEEQQILRNRFGAYEGDKDSDKVSKGEGLIGIVRALRDAVPANLQKPAMEYIAKRLETKDAHISKGIADYIFINCRENYGDVRKKLLEKMPKDQKNVFKNLEKILPQVLPENAPHKPQPAGQPSVPGASFVDGPRWSTVVKELLNTLKRPLSKDESEFAQRYAEASKLDDKKCAEELVPIIKGLTIVSNSYSNFEWKKVGNTKDAVCQYAAAAYGEMSGVDQNLCRAKLVTENKLFWDELEKYMPKND